MSKPESLVAPDVLAHALALRDLSDPSLGPHAVQKVLDAAVKALADAWRCEVVVHRASPVAPIADDPVRRAGPEPGGDGGREPARVSATHVLRTRTAAMVPPLLELLAAAPPDDVLLACPGLVYRRERGGVAAAHELDLWRIRRGKPLRLEDLARMIGVVVRSVAPGLTPSAIPASAGHTLETRRIDVRVRREWVEIGRCGLALPAILTEAGLPPDASGLVMQLDLDRLVALAKGIDDVGLLRSEEPGVAAQMLDLAPFVPPARGQERSADARAAAGVPVGAAPVSFRTLDEVRASIDEVDCRIVRLLAERRGYALQAARFKKPCDDVRVPVREEQVVANVRAHARDAGIEADLVEELYRHLMDELVRLQRAELRASGGAAKG